MKLNVIRFSVIFLTIGLAGCLKPNKIALPTMDNKAPLIEYVKSPELAKIILKNEQKKLTVSKDPFKPILTKEFASLPGQVSNGSSTASVGKTGAEDVILVGVIKMGSEYRALLRTSEKSGVFKVNDKIDRFTIASIGLDQIVLKSEGSEIVKKRGKS